MKKHLPNSLRALFLSLAVFLSLPMLAEKVEIDGIWYNLDTEGKQAEVTYKGSFSNEYDEYSGVVVIPASVVYNVTTYSVTSIGEKAFSWCESLTSVTIPNSVTSIGSSAFDGCSGLTSVTIPNSVTTIGGSAFSDCSSLTSVTIPNSVTTIGGSAFIGCSALTSVHISDIAAWCNIGFVSTLSNPLFFAHHLYLNGEEVKDLVIPSSVTSIGGYAFSGCSGLTSVTIGNSVESIGDGAFEGCSGLISVTIPNSVTSIGDYAFDGCSGLTSVTIPNSVTSIGKLVFGLCYGLKGINVEDGNKTFDSREGCNAIIETSSNTLLYGCQTTVIPNSVTSIGDWAFKSCTGLTSVTIPNSVTSIGDAAFNDCSGLTSVTIGNSVTIIGSGAFYNCSALTSVTIPNSVTIIGSGAFSSCFGLTSVTIGNSVESIGEMAFYGCSGLTSLTIGSGVEEIGYDAFANCPELLDVYCYAEKVPYTLNNPFRGSYPEYATLHVPDASIDSYKAKAPWRGFGKIVGLSGEEPEVEKCATPVVSYADGKLSMTCETEEAVFVTKITSNDFCTFNTSEIELSATYNIEVYATKANCENSDTVSVALVWVENGDVDEETGVISVPSAPVLVQGNGGVLNISGVAKNTEIVVYTISGTEVARATATEGTTTINTGLQSGTIVIVKFGNKSVKVRI